MTDRNNKKPLKIGILARGLSESVGGSKQFIADSIRALVEVDQRNHYFIFYNSSKYQFGFDQQHVHEIVMECPSKLLFDHYYFPKNVRKYALDLVYCPKNVVPLGINVKSVVTIYDLLYFSIPGKIHLSDYKLFDTLYMRYFIKRSLHRATHIHAISENTKDDIRQLFGIRDNKVSVIHLGLSSFAKGCLDKRQTERILSKMNIQRPYMFYAGTLSPRKNVSLLIRALGGLRHHIPHRLIITGGGPERSVPVHKLLQQNNLAEKTVILGTVTSDELKALYYGADFFVFPSLYEGFGLPLLEAMAFGCPVVCSNTSSIPEVVGDAALMFDPRSVQSLQHALMQITQNPSLRDSLKQKGYERVKQFSYRKTAEQLINIFESL